MIPKRWINKPWHRHTVRRPTTIEKQNSQLSFSQQGDIRQDPLNITIRQWTWLSLMWGTNRKKNPARGLPSDTWLWWRRADFSIYPSYLDRFFFIAHFLFLNVDFLIMQWRYPYRWRTWRLLQPVFPSADSRRAVVDFWRKNVHNTG